MTNAVRAEAPLEKIDNASMFKLTASESSHRI
jgi:hypothetical protein